MKYKCIWVDYSSLSSGDDGVEKTGLDSHSSSLVDANTSLLCQLHSHQQRHRMEHQQQFDTQSQIENDRMKLFDNHSPKMRKLTMLEMQVKLTHCQLGPNIQLF